MGLTGGYEISFLGIIFTAVFAMLALIKYGYFDSVQQAVTNVIYKSNEGLLVLDNDKNVLYYNSIIKQIFPDIAERRSANNVPVLCDTVEKCFDESGGITALGMPNTIETDDRIFEIKAEPILEAGYIQGYTFRAFDSTEHYRSIEKLRRSAHFDALTGLYDRELFKQEITRYLSNGGIGALLMADVDYFKAINDNFGHIVGDEVLMTLSSSAGKGTGINEMFETLYGLADKALYRTKKSGRNGYSFYEEISGQVSIFLICRDRIYIMQFSFGVN